MVAVDPHTPGLDLVPGPADGVAGAGLNGHRRSLECQNCLSFLALFIFGYGDCAEDDVRTRVGVPGGIACKPDTLYFQSASRALLRALLA